MSVYLGNMKYITVLCSVSKIEESTAAYINQYHHGRSTTFPVGRSPTLVLQIMSRDGHSRYDLGKVNSL